MCMYHCGTRQRANVLAAPEAFSHAAAPSLPPAAPGQYWAAVAVQATASTESGAAGSRCAALPWSAAQGRCGSPPAIVRVPIGMLATLKGGPQHWPVAHLRHKTSQPGHLLLHWILRCQHPTPMQAASTCPATLDKCPRMSRTNRSSIDCKSMPATINHAPAASRCPAHGRDAAGGCPGRCRRSPTAARPATRCPTAALP